MTGSDLRSWLSPRIRLSIGRFLLDAPDAQTAREIADAIHRDQSNVKKEADELVTLGMLASATPVRRPGGGRPPKDAYMLSAAERAWVEDAAEKAVPPGTVQLGQEVVVAGADESQVLDLLQVLGESQAAAHAAWGAMWGNGYIVAFHGEDPATLAQRFAAALKGARLDGRRATVADLKPGPQLVEYARKAFAEALQAQRARDDRHAGEDPPTATSGH